MLPTSLFIRSEALGIASWWLAYVLGVWEETQLGRSCGCRAQSRRVMLRPTASLNVKNDYFHCDEYTVSLTKKQNKKTTPFNFSTNRKGEVYVEDRESTVNYWMCVDKHGVRWLIYLSPRLSGWSWVSSLTLLTLWLDKCQCQNK